MKIRNKILNCATIFILCFKIKWKMKQITILNESYRALHSRLVEDIYVGTHKYIEREDLDSGKDGAGVTAVSRTEDS